MKVTSIFQQCSAVHFATLKAFLLIANVLASENPAKRDPCARHYLDACPSKPAQRTDAHPRSFSAMP